MSIHQNLRQLRLHCKMTQEQAAQKVGITRQALSSYESGRTRPDIDMLLSLATIYGTDLDGILYGQAQRIRNMRRIRLTAAILFWVLTALATVSAAFLMIANRVFPLPQGQVSQDIMPTLDAHLWLNTACGFTESLILSLLFPGFTLLLCINIKYKIPLRTKLLYGAAMGFALLVVAGLFAVADPVFTIARYATTPLWTVTIYGIFLLFDFTITLLGKRKGRKVPL